MAFWQELFCVIRAAMKVFSVNAPVTHTHTNCVGTDSPKKHISVTQKNCFGIVCVIISGRIVPCRWKVLHEVFLGILYAKNMHNLFLYCGQPEYFR